MKNKSKNDLAGNWMLALIFLILFLVMLDVQFHLIKNTLWYDSLLHALGGAWVGTVFIYLFSHKWKFFTGKENFYYLLINIVSFVALIGVAWEFYEFMFDATIGAKYALPIMQPNLADTMKDLANDLIGGIVTATIYLLK